MAVVFFDLGGAQDRLALLPEYKATRAEMPDGLCKQLEPLKALTRAMGFAGIEIEGVESDDLLAAQAVALAREGHEAIIVSADKDFAQVVDGRISILLPPPSANPKLGWRRMDEAGVVEKFGVKPAQIADYLALVGDTSDNIPGLDGVGPKTAVKWLETHGSLEGVIAQAATLKPERFQSQVAARAEDLRRNLKLTTLNVALPCPGLKPTAVDPAETFRLLGEYEMRSALAEAQKRYSGQGELF